MASSIFIDQSGFTFSGGSATIVGSMTANSLVMDAANADTTIQRGGAAGKASLLGTTPMLQLGGTTSSFPALKQNSSSLDIRLADDSNFANINSGTIVSTGNVGVGSAGSFKIATTVLIAATAPTISSGFAASGTTLTPNNGTAAFVITVGATTPGSSGVIGLPTATNGWNCYVTDITGAAAHVGLHTVQTGSTTASVTVESQNAAGVATAWAGNSILRVSCFAY